MSLQRKIGFYEKYIKRVLDIICASLAILVFWWLYAILAILVHIKLGSPILYTANRLGKNGKQFKLYKFRSMTDSRDESGNLLPDTVRLTPFGRFLRATSLDELPETFNIFLGDMSIIGPRPMPISYKDFFTQEEWQRHDVRPGLSGWAQVNGRNSISWEKKFQLDLWYVKNISFLTDCKTVAYTVLKVIKSADIGQGEKAPESLFIERANWVRTKNGELQQPHREED